MNQSKWIFASLFLTGAVALGGCKAKNEVTLESLRSSDLTTGAINGDERKHAWIVAGVADQKVEFNISVRNTQNGTDIPLDMDSVHLQGTNLYFTMPTSEKLYLDASLMLDNPSAMLPELNAATKTRAIPYIVQATYGATNLVSAPGYVEVLQPYCEVDSTPFSTLGMTFEKPQDVAPVGGWPTLLFVHGGGLNERNHVDMEAYAQAMLEQGYAVANMNYRLVQTDDATPVYSKARLWNDSVADVKCAIRYLKENSSILRLNAGKIGLVGHSSGANIALEAAMTVNSSMSEYAEQGVPIRLGPIAGAFDTSVAAIFTMDAIVDYVVFWKMFDNALADALKENGMSYDQERINKESKTFKEEQTKVNGFDPRQSGWESHPSVLAQNMVNFIDAYTDLPIFMEHSGRTPPKSYIYGLVKAKTAAYQSWKCGCTFYNGVIENAGSSKQLMQTFLKENLDTDHYNFVDNKDTVVAMSKDMLGFFNFYLKNQGSRPSTGFDYNRCAGLNSN